MKIGLFFGSFNCIHIGHTLVAINAKEEFQLDEVWFVVSPQNPFKDKSEIASVDHRLKMVKLLTKEMGDCFKCSEIELALPQPSYTSNTLASLKIVPEYKDYEFYVIMGQDSLDGIFNWIQWDYILENFKILVYDRTYGVEHDSFEHIVEIKNLHKYAKNITKLTGPIIDMSSTYIRDRVKSGKNIKFLVCDQVMDYIINNKIYSK